MNTENRLKKLEQLARLTLARVNAQELAIGALISSHQDPAKAAAELRRAAEAGLVQHLNDEMVTDETRDLVQQCIADLIWIAQQKMPPAG